MHVQDWIAFQGTAHTKRCRWGRKALCGKGGRTRGEELEWDDEDTRSLFGRRKEQERDRHRHP